MATRRQKQSTPKGRTGRPYVRATDPAPKGGRAKRGVLIAAVPILGGLLAKKIRGRKPA